MDSNIIGLDVGKRRIGVAIAHAKLGFPSPLKTIINDDNVWDALRDIIQAQVTSLIVVGIPRSLAGKDTDQTVYTKDFVKTLQQKTDIKIAFQEEDLTSHKAEEELQKSKKSYSKADIDSLAATYILEDYLSITGNGDLH